MTGCVELQKSEQELLLNCSGAVQEDKAGKNRLAFKLPEGSVNVQKIFVLGRKFGM